MRQSGKNTSPTSPTPPVNPFALARTNPNARTIKRVVGPVGRTRVRGKTVLVWMEKKGADDISTMAWTPETPLERADADEFYEVANGRSWKNQSQLRHLLREPGPWVIRLNLSEVYQLLSADAASRMLDGNTLPRNWHEADDAFTRKQSEAARLTSRQALRLIPQMMKTYDHHGVAYFEPVKPEHALRDVRLLRLKPGGWLPRVYNSYDPAALARFFDVDRLPSPSPRHPFVRVSDAFLCLLDPEGRYGPASFSFPWRGAFVWHSGCPGAGSRRHARSCDCFPAEMLGAKQMVLCHVFARSEEGPDGDGGRAPERYTYLGLGHLDHGVSAGSAHFRLEPDLPIKRLRSLRARANGRRGSL